VGELADLQLLAGGELPHLDEGLLVEPAHLKLVLQGVPQDFIGDPPQIFGVEGYDGKPEPSAVVAPVHRHGEVEGAGVRRSQGGKEGDGVRLHQDVALGLLAPEAADPGRIREGAKYPPRILHLPVTLEDPVPIAGAGGGQMAGDVLCHRYEPGSVLPLEAVPVNLLLLPRGLRSYPGSP